MRFRHLSEFARFLEERGELRRVHAPISPDLELAAIVDRLTQRRGPAVRFERIENGHGPIVANLFGSPRRVAWALGVQSLDELAGRIAKLLGMTQGGLPETLGDRLRVVGQLRELAAIGPKLARSGPCQEVVNTAAPAFDVLPALRCWPGDASPTLPGAALFTADPATGERVTGTVHVQLLGARAAALHLPVPGPLAGLLARLDERGGRLDAALVFGGEPATTVAAHLGPQFGFDPLALAGFARGQGVALVRGRSAEVEVPAEAEVVAEGYLAAGERRCAGPLALDGTYQTGPPTAVFHLTALTHRTDSTLPVMIYGRPPTEASYLALAEERLRLPFLRLALPGLVDYHVPAAAAHRSLAVAAVRPAYPGHARQILHGLWGLGLPLAKVVVLVDDDCDLRQEAEVLWRLTANVDPARDLILAEGPLNPLDPAPPQAGYGGHVGVDATRKGAAPGRGRPWPEPAVTPDELQARLDHRWAELGLP